MQKDLEIGDHLKPQDQQIDHYKSTRSPIVDQVAEYRTFKRRWVGLATLTLMNIIVSWDWLTYAPVAAYSAEYYNVSLSAINWISTAFFLAFVVASPVTICILHRSVKLSLIFAAVLVPVGNWLRYAGSRNSIGRYGYVMAGQILIGFAQPFVLAAPTRYSDLWFTNRGRVAVTALATLANPLGGALGQLVNPLWVRGPMDIPNMVLYVSIISTVCCVPVMFTSGKPPKPVGPSSETSTVTLRDSIHFLRTSLEIWLVLIPFFVYVGLFNSLSTLLNQIMAPYGFTDSQAGIGGAIMIFVGLFAAAIISPILDRTKALLVALKTCLAILSCCLLVFMWMPETGSIVGPYVILALTGAMSFAAVPVALEFLTELSYPLSPEITATVAWAGGQLFGAIFVIASNALAAADDAHPPHNMKNALIFQAVLAMVTLPLPLVLGLFGRQDKVAMRRLLRDKDERSNARNVTLLTQHGMTA